MLIARCHSRIKALLNITTFVLLSLVPQLASGQLHSIDVEASLNLNAILEHQDKLRKECKQLESIRVKQLQQVLQFEHSNQLHLDERERAIRLPAVCLLLNGPPSSSKQVAGAAPRLDLVNWIYDEDELAQLRSANSSARNKRKVNTNESSSLSNYLFDINSDDANQQVLASENNEKSKFLEQYEHLMQDERYESALPKISARVAGYLSPVVLVPGLAGSRLQARVNKPYRVNILCPKQSDWQDMWLSLRWFLPIAIDCWIDNVRLVYDPASGFGHEPPGVESRVPDFGSIDSVRFLDLKSPKLTKYFDSIIERYLKLGYQPDVNLFAAPYDFRLAPQNLENSFFVDLKQLVDRAHTANQGQKVTLVCHSMGCTNLLYFLRLQSAAWRQAKVRKMIAISSPWGGSTKALKALLVGEQFGLPIVGELKLRELIRTLPSVAYLLPQAQVFALPNQYHVDAAQTGGPVLVQTRQRLYTAAQLEQLLEDANMSLQWRWFKQTTEPLQVLDPLPDVTVDCLHSLNIPTLETIIFRNLTDFPDGPYEIVNGDGDGTVNHESLLVCAEWARKLPGRVRHKIIKNTSHGGMLNHKLVLNHITEDVTSKLSDA